MPKSTLRGRGEKEEEEEEENTLRQQHKQCLYKI
jgi:hypothetical protein